MRESFYIQKIAVLGAGVMGAQIAALCVNAGIETLLFDLSSEEGDHNAVVNKALTQLAQLKPTPLATTQTLSKIKACNYDDHLFEISDCDLIIEAIGERLDWKEALYKRISPFLKNKTILVSNTSGLSINTLAKALPETNRAQFCGVHFFNPPRYMHLAELIPTYITSSNLLDQLESWLTSFLGKGVVRAKDTPMFIANRIGVFSLLATLYHSQKMNIGLDEVDALTGAILGRPTSATFRTMDVVGLDTMLHVVSTMQRELKDDPWHAYFVLPDWLTGLIDQGSLGQKTGQGIYRKVGKTIEVYRVEQGSYGLSKASVSDELKAIMNLTDTRERMQRLFSSEEPQAQFLTACFLDLFHYSSFHLETIASTVSDVDLAMRWGFGWQKGPFETWQESGLFHVRASLEEAIKNNRTLSSAKLPNWLMKLEHFYTSNGAFSPGDNRFEQRSRLPIYERQFFRPLLLEELPKRTSTLFENEGVRLWVLQDDVAVLNFKTKANSIGQSVLDGFHQSLDIVEAQCQGLILYQHDANHFSAGADLRHVGDLIKTKQMVLLEGMVQQFQALVMRLKYSPFPTLAALRGRALGGGCELMLHCDAVVAAFESYPGLVELGVGLIPAGGGCKEMALRAASMAGGADLMGFIQPYFEQIARAIVAGSAPEALQRGYLRHSDIWVMHANEVLYAALFKLKAMKAGNYLPPMQGRFKVAGREGHARLQTILVNGLEGGFISAHDYALANQLAFVLCGGDVNAGEWVDEAWILQLEKEAFMAMAKTPSTQARIEHMLGTGKPLRN